MSRRAAEAGFEGFLEPVMTAIRREFSVGRALDGTGLGSGGRILDRLRTEADVLERRVVEPEFATYRDRSLRQFHALLDAVEADLPIAAHEEELLAHDGYLAALDPSVRGDQRAAVAKEVLARLERLGHGVEPIVRRPEDDFWSAAVAAFTREEALVLVEEAFPFTGPFRRHADLFAFEVRVAPGELLGGPFAAVFPRVTIDYTDEAIRAMTRAEERIVDAFTDDVRSRFEPTG